MQSLCILTLVKIYVTYLYKHILKLLDCQTKLSVVYSSLFPFKIKCAVKFLDRDMG